MGSGGQLEGMSFRIFLPILVVACSGVAVDPVVAPFVDTKDGGPPPTDEGPIKGVDYDPSVTANDVSILYPIAGSLPEYVGPSEEGAHGPLLSRTRFDELGVRHLDTEHHQLEASPEGDPYASLKVLALRLDPCAPRASLPCSGEVRIVLQPLVPAATPATGLRALDAALHLSYEVPDAELTRMAKEILSLKRRAGVSTASPLGPHPILQTQGLSSPFATGLRTLLLRHVGDQRMVRVTLFQHDMASDEDTWHFRTHDAQGGRLVRGDIVGLAADLRVRNAEMVAGSLAGAPLVGSRANLLDSHARTFLAPLVGRDASEGTPAEAFARVAEFEDPTKRSILNLDCANCHLAEGARGLAEAEHGLSGQPTFQSPRSTAYEQGGASRSVTNLHAFGYLGNVVSIVRRTAHETAVVAVEIEKRVQ